MHVLVLENYHGTPLGQVATAMDEAGVRYSFARLFDGEPLPVEQGFDGLVVLGGGQNALDDVNHPWFPQVLDLIRSYTAENRPVLGICLGSQLIARAFGGENRIGWQRPVLPKIRPSGLAARPMRPSSISRLTARRWCNGPRPSATCWMRVSPTGRSVIVPNLHVMDLQRTLSGLRSRAVGSRCSDTRVYQDSLISCRNPTHPVFAETRLAIGCRPAYSQPAPFSAQPFGNLNCL